MEERRQICDQISELKKNCESLVKIRDNLSSKLVQLNQVADLLIVEKQSNKYDLNLKIDPTSSYIKNFSSSSATHEHQQDHHQRDQQPAKSSMTTHDLIFQKSDSPTTHLKNPTQISTSDTFKINLSNCLDEQIAPKAEQIAQLTRDVYKSRDN